jgi:protein pelota
MVTLRPWFAAHELAAIDRLLITDALFRTDNAAARRKWVTLTEEAGRSTPRCA